MQSGLQQHAAMLSVMTAFTGLPLTAVVTEYSAVIEVLLLLYEVALHSKQALLSGVHCNAGDTAVWPGLFKGLGFR